MYVLTFIRRKGAKALPLEELCDKLNTLEPFIPFTKTYPDELQGAFNHPEHAIRAFLLGALYNGYWIGIGVGGLRAPRFAMALGAVGIPECSGEAISYSRLAVEQAPTGAPSKCVVVLGHDQKLSQHATGIARLLYRVCAERSEAENRVISLLIPGVRGQQKAVAQALGISSQAVSKTLVRAQWHEQEAALPVLQELLSSIHRLTPKY
ncbi:recombinase RecJ [Rothia sp. CCM 9418]|uniref:recombinase RecJ n=1 Tax=Rothia sp. CCM 9418 TaxID=3402661 RepID=UPI003ADF8813